MTDPSQKQLGPSGGRVVLESRGAVKRFGSATVVRRVDVALRAGQVHALVGENGAGKSTLVKILSGVERLDGGEVRADGVPVTLHLPADAATHGIATVYQELDLIDDLDVAANVMLGREPRRGPFLRRRRLHAAARESLERAGLDVPLSSRPRDLPLSKQQRVMIARCLQQDARVLILDEPTAALGPTEVRRLFDLMRSLRDDGVALLFVSHRLEEVLEIADWVTTMRDGEVVDSRATAEATQDQLIHAMTGRQLDLTAVRQPHRLDRGHPALRVRGLPTGAGDVDIEIHRGEIVGVAGLAGSGRSRLLRSIIGAPWSGGDVIVDGRELSPLNPTRAVKSGIGYLPEDRKRDGLVLELDSYFNVSLGALVQSSTWPVLRSGDRRRLHHAASGMSLRGNPGGPIGLLSGGNQQKVLLARLLATKPRVLLLDEPTRGVDIGAKKEIWELLEDLARAGTAILMVSSELPEILRLSDRILVVSEGAVVKEFPAGTSQQAIIRAALPSAARSREKSHQQAAAPRRVT